MNYRLITCMVGVSVMAMLFAACGGRSLGNNSSDSGITGSDNSNRAPTVSSISPVNGATGSNRDVSIAVTFDVPINSASVTVTSNTTCTGSFQLSTDVNFGTCIALNSNITVASNVLTVRSAAMLTATTQHYVRVTTAITNATGLTMQTQFNSSFTTGTGVTPLTNEFGTDCSAGSDTLAQAETGLNSTEANLGTARTISGLIVTGIDRFGSFYLQKANDAIYADVSTSGTACGGSGCAGNKASYYGLQLGDEVCMTITRGQLNFSVPTIRDFSAIKKTGIGSVTALNINGSGLPPSADISRRATLSGFISTKGTVGTNTDHYLTFNNTQIILRDSSSTKLTNFSVGDYVTVDSVVSWFSGSPQIAMDSALGTISSAGTAPTYSVTGTVSGWASGENFTVTLNGSSATVISANGAFSFTGSPTISGQYTVAISVSPSTYLCTLTNATGYGLANITNVSITCSPPPIYSFTDWTGSSTAGSFPSGMTFLCTSATAAGDPLVNSTMVGNYTGATNTAVGSGGVTGHGSSGISVLNTSGGMAACPGTGKLAGIEVAAPTTGKSNILVRFNAAQYANEDREHGFRFQYSTDGTNFSDFDATGARDFESTKSGSAKYDTTGLYSFGPYLMPAGANNNPNFKLRWRYYQVAGGANNRTRLLLDEVYVTDTGSTDSTNPTVGTLAGTGSGNQIDLSWSAGTDNSTVTANIIYRVYEHSASGFTPPGTGSLVYTSLPGQLAYTRTGLTGGSTYYYKILAVDNQDNLSSASNQITYTAADTTPPTVSSTSPTNGATGIALTSLSTSATFSEAMNVGSVIPNGYTIRKTDCSGTIVSAGSPVGPTTFSYNALSNLEPSTVYAHCVTTAATDVAGNAIASAYSATFTTAAIAELTSPTYVAGDTVVTLGWTNSSNANGGVRIQRATGSAPADCTSGTTICDATTSTPTAAGCNANITPSASGMTFSDTGLTNNTAYFYRICARHNSGAFYSTGATGSATPNNAFNVNSAASTANTTATVTFSAAPTAGTGATGSELTTNYKIVAGAGVCTDSAAIAVSGALLAGSVVTLTTATQSAVSYKVCVSNVTRNSDGATLSTTNASFTGTASGVIDIAANTDIAYFSFGTGAAATPTSAQQPCATSGYT